jgi:hypothetical protein
MDAIGVKADPNDKMGSAESAVKSYAQTKARADKYSDAEKQLDTIKEAHEKQVSTLEGLLLEKDKTIAELQKPVPVPPDPHIEQLKAKDKQIIAMAEQIKELKLQQPKCSWICKLFRLCK